MNKRKEKEGIGLTALNLAFILLCFVTLIPILYALSVSRISLLQVFTNSVTSTRTPLMYAAS